MFVEFTDGTSFPNHQTNAQGLSNFVETKTFLDFQSADPTVATVYETGAVAITGNSQGGTGGTDFYVKSSKNENVVTKKTIPVNLMPECNDVTLARFPEKRLMSTSLPWGVHLNCRSHQYVRRVLTSFQIILEFDIHPRSSLCS